VCLCLGYAAALVPWGRQWVGLRRSLLPAPTAVLGSSQGAPGRVDHNLRRHPCRRIK